jgi:hypothetical protein
MTVVARGLGRGDNGSITAQGLGRRLLVDVDAVRGSTYYLLPGDEDTEINRIWSGRSSLTLGIYAQAWPGEIRMSDLIDMVVRALIQNPQVSDGSEMDLSAGAEVQNQQALQVGATWVRLMAHSEHHNEDQRQRMLRVRQDDEESLLILLDDD